MKYNEERWNVLEDYVKSNSPHTEEMYRRAMGYMEEAIVKPTIAEKIVLAWSEYLQYYLTEYKVVQKFFKFINPYYNFSLTTYSQTILILYIFIISLIVRSQLVSSIILFGYILNNKNII